MKARRFDDLRLKPEPPADPVPAYLRMAFQRCFSTEDGSAVLEYLRTVTMRSAHGPDVSDSALRHFEGQRFLVRRIEELAGSDKGA